MKGSDHPETDVPPEPGEAPQGGGLTWGWRVALFIWASAFFCLLGYELLSTLVRSVSKLL